MYQLRGLTTLADIEISNSIVNARMLIIFGEIKSARIKLKN